MATKLTFKGFMYYISNVRQKVDWYFEISAYTSVAGVTFHPAKGTSVVFGVGYRSASSKSIELFQVSNRKPQLVEQINSVRLSHY